jgi:hypothetical protein
MKMVIENCKDLTFYAECILINGDRTDPSKIIEDENTLMRNISASFRIRTKETFLYALLDKIIEILVNIKRY